MLVVPVRSIASEEASNHYIQICKREMGEGSGAVYLVVEHEGEGV